MRGMGDLIGDEVDPETYNFKTFDITFRPSDPNARMTPLTESENNTRIFTESEQSDRLIEAGMYDNIPELLSDKNRVQLCKDFIKVANESKQNKDLTYTFKIHIKVTFKGESFGNVFISKTPSGNVYRVFSNKVKGLESNISAGNDITSLAKSYAEAFDNIAEEQSSNEQLSLDI